MSRLLTLAAFNRLPRPNQYGTLEADGIYLQVHRIEGAHKIALFALNGFYVQVWYNQTADKLVKCLAFDSYDLLDPFLESIDLTSLYCRL